MKKIKELEARAKEIEHQIEIHKHPSSKSAWKGHLEFNQAKINALKDVLKLIDKWCSKHKGSTLSKYNIDELKARIEG